MYNYQDILVKLSQRQATVDEQETFRQWLKNLTPAQINALLDEYGETIAALPALTEASNRELLVTIHTAIDQEESAAGEARRRSIVMRWMGAAAAVFILAIGTLVLFTQTNKSSLQHGTGKKQLADLPPGKSGAVLTLTDGTQISLDSLGNGVVANDGGAETVLHNGKLIYNSKTAGGDPVGTNVMTTPKGRQFTLELPDGTLVWLNAASTISYPTAFTGNTREVTVKGEAYFQVARNSRMPFLVKVNNKATVEVLGTDFNVDAYDNNEAVSATLLNGSIRVTASSVIRHPSSVILTPGQQAQLSDELHVLQQADTSKVMAWKNGLFNFEGASLREVMKQLERWYDIEVVYERGVPDVTFGGEMTKNIPLSGLLLMLEKSDIHFRLEKRKLIVLP